MSLDDLLMMMRRARSIRRLRRRRERDRRHLESEVIRRHLIDTTNSANPMLWQQPPRFTA